ncbi:hypothetical protein OIU77_006138 [Salix suchowensis]|uniref:Uncharacterized protein n=1 Tax=Salix suchowensis TaxID=1278906 RepID=A0ABQ9AS08_9ROSI|nr:hypothetical protein OIU77_006138 [Salix suchowensis]
MCNCSIIPKIRHQQATYQQAVKISANMFISHQFIRQNTRQNHSKFWVTCKIHETNKNSTAQVCENGKSKRK